MAEKVNFNDGADCKTNGGKRNKFLFVPKDDHIVVRFVGHQEKVYQKWNGSSKTYVCYDNKVDDSVGRIVSLVIDRSDDQIKALMIPLSAFRMVGAYDKTHDFKISRKGRSLDTRYIVESLGVTEVEDTIEKKVEATLSTYSLGDMFVKKIDWEVMDVEPEPIENRFDILDL
jgi:hypothetical protein